MNVLIHGTPFFCDMGILGRYSGAHEFRTFGPDRDSDYTYAPLEESASEAIARFSNEWQPDLLMCWQPEAHPPPRGIEDVSIRTVALVSDWNVYYPVLERNLARYDIVLTDKPGVDVFSNDFITAHHIRPLYSQITPIHFDYETDRDIDVLFIGNLNHAAHHQRAAFLERMAKLSDRYRVVIATDIEGEAYGKLMSRARIVFNHSIRGEVNLRVFETMACGAMAMLEEENTEVRDWFTDREQIVLYNTSNFETLLLHYLEHPTDAARIASAGHRRIANMSGERVLDTLIEHINALPISDRGYHSLPERDQLLQTALMYGRLPHQRWRPYVAGLFGYLLDAMPQDADVHAAYVHFLLGTPEKDWHRIRDHAKHAADLARDSIPYAWNELQIEEWYTSTKPNLDALLPLFDREGIQGAGLLLGTQADSFWTRWYKAVALGRNTPNMLKAHVHIRALEAGGTTLHLEHAQRLDPENMDWIIPYAELLWNDNQKQKALTILTDALANRPLDIATHERLIEMLQALGLMDEARVRANETLRMLEPFQVPD